MQDELNLDMTKTYIHDGNEYILTGRIAEKTSEEPAPPTRSRSGRRASVSPRPAPKPDPVVEIKPAPRSSSSMPNVGAAFGTKWVKYSELHMVRDILSDGEGEKNA